MTKTFAAVSTMLGTIIGAGFLGIPYVIMRSGFTIGVIHLLFIAIAVAITTLYLGEIALRTKSKHQLTGYAEKYLGKKGKIWMLIAVSIGIYSALVAYIIGESTSLSYLFFSSADYSLQFGIAFWLILSAIAYLGIRALEKGESLGIIIIFILVTSISLISFNKIDINNLNYINPENFFVPFGVILFAFLGFSVIPEVEIILGKDKKLMKKSIFIAYAIALLTYIVFTIVVLGSQGQNTPQLATLALGIPFILLGMFTMFTAYLALSTALVDTFKFDLKKSKFKSWLYTIFLPIILFVILNLLNKAEFTKVIGIGGAISGTITAILILLMAKRAKVKGDRKPEYEIPYSKIAAALIALIFVIGTIFEITNAVK